MMADEPLRVRQLLHLPKDELWEAAYGDHEDFQVITEWPVEQGRWTTVYSFIVQQVSTGKFYEGWYTRGSTEMQEGSEDICEYLTEVQLVAKTVLMPEVVLRPQKKEDAPTE